MTQSAGKSDAWAARNERGHTIAIKLIVWIALHLGRPATRVLLYPICLYFLVFSAASRTASSTYLRRALGREPCLHDRVYLLNNEIDLFDLHVEGEEIAINEIAQGPGCFLFGAHIGSFEVLRALGHRQNGVKLSLLMYEENARKINSVLSAINPDLAIEVIALGHSDSMLAIEQRLDDGHCIGMLADRGLSLENQECVTVSFLGENARFPIGPFRVAALLRRPVLFMVGVYGGGRRYE